MDVFDKIFRSLRHRGMQVFVLLSIYLIFAPHLPLVLHQGFYTISLFIKDLLIWMLPLTISLFIAHAICSFQNRALLFVIAVILFEAISNLTSVFYAFGSGHIAAKYLPAISLQSIDSDFNPLWRFPFSKPFWWSADKGTFFGLIMGAIGVIFKKSIMKEIIDFGKSKAEWILTKIFSRLIPLFVLGFVAKMYWTELFSQVLAHYGILLVWLVLFLSLYIVFLFFLGSNGTLKDMFKNFRNVLPAGAIAFTSGCSLSTMPWTIAGTSRNLKNPEFAKAVIPATTNIQQIGDCIINAFLCFIIYRHFNGANPDFFTWFSFSMVFVLARFATAAVLGGAIFIMLPIYESYLGFNAEMIAIILAFNVILDPIVTSSNVLANGALCRVFEKVWLFLLKIMPSFLCKKANENVIDENLK